MARLNRDIEPEFDRGDGRDRYRGLGRVLGFGEDPLTAWSFQIAKLGGLRVRVHSFLLLVWLAIELIGWIPPDRIGLVHVACATGSLVVLAVVREVGRGLFARWLRCGGEVVVVWPLGGLNPVSRRGVVRPVLAEAGGLMVGALLVPVLAGAAVGVGISAQHLLFNPFAIRPVVGDLHGLGQTIVWWAYFMNGTVLVLNLLVPMVPLDAGRMVGAWLRERNEYRGVELAAKVGLGAAVVLFLVGMVVGETRLMAVAVLGGLATVLEVRRRQFMETAGEYGEPEFAQEVANEPEPEPPARRHAPHVAATVSPLDAILEKISREGMGSLTPAERDALAKETERRRRT